MKLVNFAPTSSPSFSSSLRLCTSLTSQSRSRVAQQSQQRSCASSPTTAKTTATTQQPVHKKRIFSGIQPTGKLHLGNYLGAVSNWVKLQHEESCEILFSIVDLHSLTTPKGMESSKLRNETREMCIALLAAGIDPKKVILYNQSKVSGHAELGWILGCVARTLWLDRMAQFKEKSAVEGAIVSVGLYSYPVLQAADVLLYKATDVPVGEDQKQHLELCQKIAVSFNAMHKTQYFPIPKVLFTPTKRVMNLQDGTKKMSKSALSDFSRINLTDDADTIAKKIRKATTDSHMGISYNEEQRPEISNLVEIFASLSGETIEAIVEKYKDSNSSNFKRALSDVVVEKIAPVSKKIELLRHDIGEIDKILEEGAVRAREIADKHMKEIRDMMGLL